MFLTKDIFLSYYKKRIEKRGILFSSGWKLVFEKKECTGSEVRMPGLFTDITGCANSCAGKSTMLIYARRDGQYCSNEGCQCYCESEGSSERTCHVTNNVDWDLYALVIKQPGMCGMV